jgi:hypothetical protein
VQVVLPEQVFEGVPAAAMEFITRLTTANPQNRPSATEAQVSGRRDHIGEELILMVLCVLPRPQSLPFLADRGSSVPLSPKRLDALKVMVAGEREVR